MGNRIYDVILVGGGVMGCSTAYSLSKADPNLNLLVIERDPTYEYASSALSMANVRIQFSLKENIQISQYALEVLEIFEEEMAVGGERPSIGFRREGNLFLLDAAGEATAVSRYLAELILGRDHALDLALFNPQRILEGRPLSEGRLV